MEAGPAHRFDSRIARASSPEPCVFLCPLAPSHAGLWSKPSGACGWSDRVARAHSTMPLLRRRTSPDPVEVAPWIVGARGCDQLVKLVFGGLAIARDAEAAVTKL